MKTMKCKSCGANLKFNDNDRYATCPYCKSKYKVSDDIHINLDDNTKDVLKTGLKVFGGASLIVPIIAFIIFIVIVVIMINVFQGTGNNQADNTINTEETISKSGFNAFYEMYAGTQSKFFLENVLDHASTNNKKNKDLLVEIVYQDKKTTDSDEIIDIKHSLNDKKKYEVKLDYNDKGYVNKITIQDLG